LQSDGGPYIFRQFTQGQAKTDHIDFDEGEKGIRVCSVLVSEATANFLDTRRYFILCSRGVYLYGQSVGSFQWLGLPRSRTEVVLVGGWARLSDWCWLHWMLLV
jgi:hypothetical protein